MKIAVFASGSGGNCMLLSHKDTHILIDAGISMRRIESSLRSLGLTVKDIGGVLITHEHSDHISGLKMLIKHHGINIFAPRTVANRLRGMLPEAEENITVLPVGTEFEFGWLKVRAFHTPHDTDESVGYRIEGDNSFSFFASGESSGSHHAQRKNHQNSCAKPPGNMTSLHFGNSSLKINEVMIPS